jgi:hypothetical protein
MKKLYTLLAGMLLSGAAFAQLPNGGFENWAGTPLTPTGWQTATLDVDGQPVTSNGVIRSTDAKSGTYSLRLEVTLDSGYAIATALFPLGGVAVDSFIFNFKKVDATADTGTIRIRYVSVQNGVSVAGATITRAFGYPNWTRLAAAIRDNNGNKALADTGFVELFGGFDLRSITGDYSQFDDISLKISVGGLTTSLLNRIEGSVFPAPASDVVNVRFDARAGDASIIIYDMNGRAMISRDLNGVAAGDRTETLNITELPAGNYLVQVKQGAFDFTRPFSVVR